MREGGGREGEESGSEKLNKGGKEDAKITSPLP